MRVLGSISVLLLLIVSGGVSVRAEEPLDQTPATSTVQQICAEPQPRYVHIDARNPLLSVLRDARSVIDLNTRGYNYIRAGEHRPPDPRVPAAPER